MENPVIDFGKVILGEDSTLVLKIQNMGALDTEMYIRSQKGVDLQSKTDALSTISGKGMSSDDDHLLPLLT